MAPPNGNSRVDHAKTRRGLGLRGLGESTALIHHASAGLAPVRSDKWWLHLARKPNSIIPGIAGGDSGKNKNVGGGDWVAATCIPVRDKENVQLYSLWFSSLF